MIHTVRWIDHHRDPQCPPDPAYPDGKDVEMIAYPPLATGKTCLVKLPYPAKRCGAYLVQCGTCEMSAMVTTAGRRDDPRSVRLICRRKGYS
jgi:hypothetical protein